MEINKKTFKESLSFGAGRDFLLKNYRRKNMSIDLKKLEMETQLVQSLEEFEEGESRTCLLHPASTTHRQLSEEDLIKCGVLPEAVRINVGIENINNIIADIEQALAKL